MKILYKCEKCGYETDRLLNYKRHEQRKTPCYMKLEDSVYYTKVPKNINPDGQNNNPVGQNNNPVGQNNNPVGQNNNPVGQNNNPVGQNNNHVGQNNNPQEQNIFNHEYRCSKCFKLLQSKKRLKTHQDKCDGTHKLQCKVCLKMFTTQQGKWKHMQYVKCNPPSTQQIINNKYKTNK